MPTDDVFEPHFSPVPIQLTAQDALLQPGEELIVQPRDFQTDKLLTHDAEVLSSPGIKQVGKAVVDELADDLAHLLGRTFDGGVVFGGGENLLELGHRVLCGNGGALALS